MKLNRNLKRLLNKNDFSQSYYNQIIQESNDNEKYLLFSVAISNFNKISSRNLNYVYSALIESGFEKCLSRKKISSIFGKFEEALLNEKENSNPLKLITLFDFISILVSENQNASFSKIISKCPLSDRVESFLSMKKLALKHSPNIFNHLNREQKVSKLTDLIINSPYILSENLDECLQNISENSFFILKFDEAREIISNLAQRTGHFFTNESGPSTDLKSFAENVLNFIALNSRNLNTSNVFKFFEDESLKNLKHENKSKRHHFDCLSRAEQPAIFSMVL